MLGFDEGQTDDDITEDVVQCDIPHGCRYGKRPQSPQVQIEADRGEALLNVGAQSHPQNMTGCSFEYSVAFEGAYQSCSLPSHTDQRSAIKSRHVCSPGMSAVRPIVRKV